MSEPSAPTSPADPAASGPSTPGPGKMGPVRRFLSRWGLPLFALLVLVWGHQVLLPFIFASLIAYILAPVVAWMCNRKDGTRRMPRGLAIIICYLVFIAAVVGFLFVLVPRMAKDLQRIGKEAPGLYKKMNEEWTPEIAHWLENRFPSLKPPKKATDEPPIVPDVPMPPNTAFTITPLPDGRFAIQIAQGGVEITPQPNGAFRVVPNETAPEPMTLEEKLRGFMQNAIAGLRSKVDDLVRFGRDLVGAVIIGVFTFFLVLMIAAFMLIDLEKVHAFLRSLFPKDFRDDYDVIIQGIDRGLSGVIRGQLLICLINGVLTFVGISVFGVKYGLILAVVAAVMSLIPIFGSILSSIPIVFSALVSGDTGLDVFRAVAMLAWIVGIHLLEANFLNPKIIGTSAKIHPVLVVFSLILGEKAYGLTGALLAVPVLSMIQVMFLYFYNQQWKHSPGGRARRPSTQASPGDVT
ncbi:MAG TPA: AI-2E family transporter [Kofleriaceae bacterium]|nr:AI-2E family transporter [Kofleriaceae bacterium]